MNGNRYLQNYLYYFMYGSFTRYITRFGGTFYDGHRKVITKNQS